MNSSSAVTAFLKISRHFKLGILPTEQRHPKTIHLATLAKNDLSQALDLLHEVDTDAISVVLKKQRDVSRLAVAIRKTWKDGGRVFFYGCGATGRLSLSLEYLWRSTHQNKKNDRDSHCVYGFMSGGDLALVRSIENFEDHPEFGARQVREIGFQKNDLMIAITEGGETPSVIGAIEKAAQISKRKPWFLYCNPDSVLKKHIARSRRVLNNKNIEKVSLVVGPMSLSGSTRLQATTVLQLFAGQALFHETLSTRDLRHFYAYLKASSYQSLKPFIKKESAAYKKGDYFLYASDRYAMTVLTDTTERSPTFSLPGFENQLSSTDDAALAYAYLPGAKNSQDAWQKLLLREPLPLEWKVLKSVAGRRRLYGFDFSRQLPKLRAKKIGAKKKLQTFKIDRKNSRLTFAIGKTRTGFNVAGLHPLYEHLFLKLLLNAHSTLTMGRLDRYESNIMTWVRPSNSKLIDRAIRYTRFLLAHEEIHPSYDEIAHAIFRAADRIGSSDSVVLSAAKDLKKKNNHRPSRLR